MWIPCNSPSKTDKPIRVRFRSGTETLVYRPVSDWWWGKATEREFGEGWRSKLPLEIVAYEEMSE
ncbi:MAG: hypothetical protein ACK5X3_14815 [Pseudomonadota bacterium]